MKTVVTTHDQLNKAAVKEAFRPVYNRLTTTTHERRLCIPQLAWKSPSLLLWLLVYSWNHHLNRSDRLSDERSPATLWTAVKLKTVRQTGNNKQRQLWHQSNHRRFLLQHLLCNSFCPLKASKLKETLSTCQGRHVFHKKLVVSRPMLQTTQQSGSNVVLHEKTPQETICELVNSTVACICICFNA